VKRLSLRLLRYTLIGLVALMLLIAVVWWWLTGTRSGASFLLGQAESRLEKFEYDALEGGLSKGVVLRGVEFEQSGLGLNAGRLELAVGIRPLPLRVTVRRLALADVELRLPPPAPEEPEAAPFELGDYSAPVEVVVDDFELIDFTLLTAGAETPALEIQRASFAGRYAEVLQIDSLELDMEPYAVSAAGQLGLTAPWTMALGLDATWAVDDQTTQALSMDIEGPLNALDLQLEGDGPLQARARASVGGLPSVDSLDGQVSLTGSLQDWPGIAGSIQGLQLDAGGAIDDWAADLQGRVEWPDQPAVDVTLAASGNEEQITISRGDLALLDGHVRVTGSAELGDPVRADARLLLENLDFTTLYPDWPSQARLSGGLDARWDGQVLQVDDIALRAPPSPLTLNGGGSLDSETEALAVQLEWASLVWPPVLGDDEPMFSSESGRLDASGTLDEWQAELEAWMTAPEQPRARIELEAEGDAEAMQIRSGRVNIDAGGQVGLTGRIGYAGSPSADLDLTLAELDPGLWVPELSGTVNGDLSLVMAQLQPLVASVAINRLDGMLRNQPLTGSGALALRETAVDQADLNVSLGENSIQLASDGGEAWQLQLQAERLVQLWPDLTGGLNLDARFNPGEKTLGWTLDSPGVAWLDLRAAQIESTGRANWGEQESVDARINAQDVDLNPWERLDQVEVTLAGNCASHLLTAYFSGTRATLDLGLGGELPGCLDRADDWTGNIRRMVISDTPLGTWQLDENLPVRVQEGVVRAGPACLWTPGGTGRLCLNELEGGATGNAAVAFNSVPLDLLLLPMDPVFTLGSDLRGLAEVSWSPAGVRGIDAELLLGPGAARMLESEDDLVRIRGARLGLRSPQPGALDAELVFRLEAESLLTASATIPDLNTPQTMRLDASADLSLPNLGALNRLVPQLDQLGGRLDAEFNLSGPLSSPDFDGRIAISEGRFFNAPLGTRVEQLAMTLEADQAGGRIDGSFVAGEGRAELRGDLDLDAPGGWRGNLVLDGNDLRLFNVDWLELTASPDLSLGFQAELLEINGGIDIDRARLGLPPGSEQRVAVSPDVVVEGRQDPAEAEEALPRRDIVGNVRIGLSDDVRFAAAGLETNVAGELELEWVRQKTLPTARGTVNLVDGSYSAYGQNLQVSEGRVVFTGNPVVNPVLSIEAVRDIFGDPQVEEAGVSIRGPAQDPEILLFTSPPTSREKALAYILTGADFDHAAGQGAFNVGFWVLPSVFVSYGLGLFDTGNVLAARWELSRRWGLRATSGERDTGADVSFIIDR